MLRSRIVARLYSTLFTTQPAVKPSGASLGQSGQSWVSEASSPFNGWRGDSVVLAQGGCKHSSRRRQHSAGTCPRETDEKVQWRNPC